jgi:hypothetical protein
MKAANLANLRILLPKNFTTLKVMAAAAMKPKSVVDELIIFLILIKN